MTDTDLPWRIFGRLIRPYVLAVNLATLVIVWSITTESAVGELLDQAPGHMVGTAAALAVALRRFLGGPVTQTHPPWRVRH